MTKLNENEKLVYRVLNEIGGDYAYFTFAYISSACGLDRKVVRRVCRSLARKGFAEYGKGLFTEEGLTAGSGYRALSEREIMFQKTAKAACDALANKV